MEHRQRLAAMRQPKLLLLSYQIMVHQHRSCELRCCCAVSNAMFPQIATLTQVLDEHAPDLVPWSDDIYNALGVTALADFKDLSEDDIRTVRIPRLQLNKLLALARNNGSTKSSQ
jgi:hypothetical protein